MVAKQLIKGLASAVDRVVPPPTGITVLIYHRVGGGTGGEVDLDPSEFERQLDYLAHHTRVLSLDAAIGELTSDDEPAAGVAITFDDGTVDFPEHVVPRLAHYNLQATLYVATQFVDEQTKFPWGAPPATWSGLEDAVASGVVSIGSHTHSHWLLDRLDPAIIDDDLDRSIDLIGSRLGRDPLDFAYPKALPGSAAAEIAVRRRFRSAALAGNRVNRPHRVDTHRLARTPIQRSDGFDHFVSKAHGGLRLEGELRSAIARTRYRGTAK